MEDKSFYDIDKLMAIIEKYRKEHHITLRNFVQRTGIAYSTYHSIKRKEITVTSQVLHKFALAMQMPYLSLLSKVLITGSDEKDILLNNIINLISDLNKNELEKVYKQLEQYLQ